MAEGVFDKSIVAVTCRQCGFRNERTVGWMKSHSMTECDRCTTDFSIVATEISRPVDEVERTMEGLRAMLRNRASQPEVEEKKPRRGWRL